MTVKSSNWLILLGLLIAITGLIRSAPELVRAMPDGAVDPVEAALAESVVVTEEASLAMIPVTSISVDPSPYPTRMSYGLLPLPTRAGPAIAATQRNASWKSLVHHEENEPVAPAIPQGEAPVRLVIPSIDLDAPIVVSEAVTITLAGQNYRQWLVPDGFVAGWHEGSQLIGLPGNTVINGHHNINGMVFATLEQVDVGDVVQVFSQSNLYEYVITNKMILPEKYELIDVRMENARWILPSKDERLTLLTCWPETSNTHRLIVVASRVNRDTGSIDLSQPGR
jgi:LPXTG-site transpeptidase (sortase) family protein